AASAVSRGRRQPDDPPYGIGNTASPLLQPSKQVWFEFPSPNLIASEVTPKFLASSSSSVHCLPPRHHETHHPHRHRQLRQPPQPHTIGDRHAPSPPSQV